MKGRWIVLGAGLGLLLALTFGFVHASGGSMPGPGTGGAGSMMDAGEMQATMQEVHDSPGMQALHAQMPEELRAQCEAMHEQMSQMMASMPGMGGMAGMGGSAGAGSHSAHHPATAGS